MLENGSLPGVLKTASFGSRSTERLAALRRHQPTGPLMCSEFWNGWFDSWGGHHHITDAAQTAADLDDLLAAGASVNLYMFHGGTNFGFTNGANDKGVYQPIVTSYDYDAPLDEAGNPTEKFWAFREVIARHAPVPAERPAARVACARAHSGADDHPSPFALWRTASATGCRRMRSPRFDALGHFGPLAVYATPHRPRRTGRPRGRRGARPRDRVRRRHAGSACSRATITTARSPCRPARAPSGLLVEDHGRVDYGTRIGEPKGLIGAGRLGGIRRSDRGLCCRSISAASPDHGCARCRAIRGAEASRVRPSHVATFTLDDAADLFLDTSGWGKGVAWVNGFALGRYWSRGPQRTLYVPRPVVRAGVNEVTILELDAGSSPAIRFVSRPELGHCEE